jgi:hypothetical protein
MIFEPSSDWCASLHLKLLKLQHAPPGCDQSALAYFKWAALHALADAESDFAISQNLSSPVAARAASGWTIAELEAVENGFANTPLQKLD